MQITRRRQSPVIEAVQEITRDNIQFEKSYPRVATKQKIAVFGDKIDTETPCRNNICLHNFLNYRYIARTVDSLIKKIMTVCLCQ